MLQGEEIFSQRSQESDEDDEEEDPELPQEESGDEVPIPALYSHMK